MKKILIIAGVSLLLIACLAGAGCTTASDSGNALDPSNVNYSDNQSSTTTSDSGVTLEPSNIRYGLNQSSLSNVLKEATAELQKLTGDKKTVASGDNLDVVMILYNGDKPTSYVKTTVTAGNEYSSATQGTRMDASGNAEIYPSELTNIAKNVVGKSTNTMLECDGSGTAGDSVTMGKAEFQSKFGISDEDCSKFTVGTTVMAPGSFMTATRGSDNQYTLSQVNRGGIITNVTDDSITYNTGSTKIQFFVYPSENK